MESPLRTVAPLLLAALAAAGCATLPDYAAPRRIASVGQPEAADLVRYRALARDDFRGERPPAEFAGYRQQIGAATCTQLRASRRSQLSLQWIHTEGGEVFYEAAPHKLRFVALMDRNCSWWNPRPPGLSADYVLEHEQIHFALYELEARALNARLPEIKARIRGRGTTIDEAVERATEQLDEIVEEAIEAALERNREFDEDTSLGQFPDRQRKWRRRVQDELARYR